MKSLINIPQTRAYVRSRFINPSSNRIVECYLVAVCCVLNEAPKLMVLTEHGAAYCYVPPHAICFNTGSPEKMLSEVCSWDCLSDRGEIVELEFLRNWSVRNGVVTGRYMFTLHFDPTHAWGRTPEQLKLFHFIQGNDGNLHIWVNNQMLWLCEAITNDADPVWPKSNTRIWYVED